MTWIFPLLDNPSPNGLSLCYLLTRNCGLSMPSYAIFLILSKLLYMYLAHFEWRGIQLSRLTHSVFWKTESFSKVQYGQHYISNGISYIIFTISLEPIFYVITFVVSVAVILGLKRLIITIFCYRGSPYKST